MWNYMSNPVNLDEIQFPTCDYTWAGMWIHMKKYVNYTKNYEGSKKIPQKIMWFYMFGHVNHLRHTIYPEVLITCDEHVKLRIFFHKIRIFWM